MDPDPLIRAPTLPGGCTQLGRWLLFTGKGGVVMAAKWQLSWLNFKNMKGRYFAPWILCYLLLPAMVHFRKMSLIGELYFEDAFFPLFAT